jgi:hypothetical protein
MAFDLFGCRLRKLASDACARKIASQLVQPKRDGEPLFTGHAAIAFQLLFQGKFRFHEHFLLRCSHCIGGFGGGEYRLLRQRRPAELGKTFMALVPLASVQL